MTATEFLLQSRRVATREGLRPAALRIRRGRIAAVEEISPAPALPLEDVGDAVVFPGLVDTHVHVNEPGRSEWEGFETATLAAAAGGITTLLDMPLNCVPPTTTLEALRIKTSAVAGRSTIHVGFWGGVVPGNRDELERLRLAGVFGFKCFLVPSGVPEFPELSESELGRAMSRMASLGTVLLVHAEDPRAIRAPGDARRTAYASYLASRPKEAENSAIEMILRLCRETGARVHLLHLSSAEALESIARARGEGLAVTVETCPHYLFFAAEEIGEGQTQFKCAPPIREAENRDRLWEGLRDRTIDMIVSDHSPCPADRKRIETGDFFDAWGGIASLELTLAAAWTGAAERGIPLFRLAEWMSAAPARLAGLDDCKGAIEPGKDADLVVWDPEAERRVIPESLRQRHKLTPYAGRTLKGVVRATYLKGEKIYERGRVLARSRGEVLLSG